MNDGYSSEPLSAVSDAIIGDLEFSFGLNKSSEFDSWVQHFETFDIFVKIPKG